MMLPLYGQDDVDGYPNWKGTLREVRRLGMVFGVLGVEAAGRHHPGSSLRKRVCAHQLSCSESLSRGPGSYVH